MPTTASTSYGERLVDRLNPVLLREFRQLSRNKIVFTIIFLALAAFLLTSGIYIMTAMSESSRGDMSLEQGNTLFNLISTMLILSTFTFVPLYTGIRFGLERSKGRQDLMYTSSIPPWHIVFGKTMTAAQLALLIFSLALPFLSFTYLLRGVDLANAALNIVVLFVGAVLGAQATLLFTAIPMSLVFRIVIIVLFILPTVFSYYLIASIALIWSGGMKQLLSEGFTTYGTFSFIAFLATLTLLLSGSLFTMTSALVAPPSSNRALVIRTYNSVAAVVLIGAAMLCLRKGDLPEIMHGILIFLFVAACLAFIASSGERDERSQRVRRKIPRARDRLLAFFFFQGRINGLLWSLGWMVILSAAICLAIYLGGDPIHETLAVLTSVVMYTLGYTLVSVLIQRKLLARRFNTGITPVLTGILLFIMVIVPFLFAFFKGSLSDMDKVWSPLSPVDGSYTDHLGGHIIGATVIAAMGIILNLNLILESIRSFTPLKPVAPLPVPPPIDQPDNVDTVIEKQESKPTVTPESDSTV